MPQLQMIKSTMLCVTLAAACPATAWAGALATGDFNGDGFADLAVGVSREDVGSAVDAGAVNVIYGSADKLASANNQSWNQNRPGIDDNAANDEHFGMALAVGDFNADGFDDLAIAVPGEAFNNVVRGAVHILYGSAGGLTATSTQFFDQDAVGSSANSKGQFGETIGVGDFNGDGFDDLVISEPGRKVGGELNAGQIDLVHGSATGLDTMNVQQWTVVDLGNVARPGDEFGRSLARGDFNDDGFDDLAVGLPGRPTHANPQLGSIMVLYGTAAGLDDAGVQEWSPSTPGMISGENEKERFGEALAAGDFNGDGWDDLAIGAPGKVVNSQAKAGAVFAVYGTAMGLDVSGNQYFNQNTSLIEDDCEPKDRFGSALTVADFNDDGRDDLAIGAPGESLILKMTDTAGAGQVHVLSGSITGLTANLSQVWNMKINGIKGDKGASRFGSGLAAADFDGDGHIDLVIGSPQENVGTVLQAGAVHVIYSTDFGLEITDNQIWHQDRDGIKDVCETDDRFGQ